MSRFDKPTTLQDTNTAAVAISYASEVCPVALRGYLTTWGNSCWGIGQLIAIAVIRSMFGREDQWAYRIPYGLQVSRRSAHNRPSERR